MHDRIFQTEKLRRFTLFGIITLLILLASLFVMLQTSYIQTKIIQYITKEFSDKFNTKIYIKSVNITLFKGFKLKNIIIEDFDKDTMFSVKNLYILPSGIPEDFNNLSFKKIEFDSLYLDLHEVKKDTLNIDLIIDAFLGNEPNEKEKDFKLNIKNLKLKNSVFKYKETDSIKNIGTDYEDLYFTEINTEIENIEILNSSVKSKFKSFSLKEKSGLKITEISTEKNYVSPEKILIKNLKVITRNSNLQFDSLNLNYPDRYIFSDYKNSLKVNASFKKGSFISFKDLNLLLQDTVKREIKIFVSGNINGMYNDIKISEFNLYSENLFFLKTNSHIKNISNLKNSDFDIKISDLKINMQKTQGIKIPGKNIIFNVPDELKKLNIVGYKGNTKGKLNNFKTNGIIYGEFGKIALDAVAQKDSASYTTLTGKISGNGINLTKALNDKNFGDLSFNQNFTFSYLKNKKIKLKTAGKINRITYKNFTYKDISLFADINDKKLDSININANMPEITATINGKGNFSEKIPSFDINIKIEKSKLKNLNLQKQNSSLSFALKGKFKGLNIDDFTGNISLTEPLIFKNDTTTSKINRLTVSSFYETQNSKKFKKIILKSDAADAYLNGSGKISTSINLYKSLLKNLLTKNKEAANTDKKQTEDFLDFNILIKKTGIITQIFSPETELSDNTVISGYYRPYPEKFNISLNSEKLSYNSILIKDFYAMAYTKNGKIFAGTGGSSVKQGKMLFAENVSLEGEIKKDTVNFNLIWNNFKDTANYSADIVGNMNIIKKENNKIIYKIKFNDSKITVNNILWKFNNAGIKIDSSHITVNNLNIKHLNQQIYLDGNISKYQGDILYAVFKNIDLEIIRPLIPENMSVKGTLNGMATLADLYSNPLIFTKDSITKLEINNINLGNFYIKSIWDNAQSNIKFNAYNLKGKRRFMNDSIYGNYNPETKNINAVIDIRSMLLKTLKDYYEEFVEFNNSAYLTGIINIKGKINKPEINGNIKIKQTTAYIKYLNTFNIFDEINLNFDQKNITVNKTKIKPYNSKGNAYISGKIHHKNFSDFILNIDIQTNKYKILEIIPTDSSYYYGTAFATGNINFSGPLDNIFLDANITTDKNTEIFIPVTSDKTYNEENRLLTFVTDPSLYKNKKNTYPEPSDISGFSMNMKLDVTPEAKIQILPDENSGEISTRGNGGLNLTLDKNGNFNIFGTYVISKGNYEFNIENIIRKNFIIQDGSTIEWFGDPENAKVNINAVYVLNNVALEDLTQDPEETRRTKVECLINISGKLLNPEFKLDILIPETLTEYTAKLNNLAENEKNEQFLSLLLLGNFQALPGIKQDNIGGNQVTGEILAKQLNSLLRKIKYVNLNVDYESGTAGYTDEYKIGVSKTFLDDRIELKGNLGIGGKETQNTENNYIGEFEIEAKLNKKGTVKAKVYNKANDKIENDGDYIQGIGFIWQRDFDKIFNFKKKNKKDSTSQNPVKKN